MFSCDLLHGVLGIMCPMDIRFHCTHDTYVVFANVGACVIPFGPVLVSMDTSGILEGKAESGRMIVWGDCNHGIAPS